MDLYRVIREIALATRTVLVGVSGKDSLATLDLCRRFIPEVSGFFMYLVPDLGFQERYLEYVENRWRIKVHRFPHWQLAGMLKNGSFRPPNPSTAQLTVMGSKDMEQFLRLKLGVSWIAYGIRRSDGFTRRSLLGKPGAVVDLKRRVCHPIADWSKAHVFAYLRQRKIMLPPEYRGNVRSFCSLNADELTYVRDHHPKDYEKIEAYFPHCGATIARAGFAKQVPIIPDSGSPSGAN